MGIKALWVWGPSSLKIGSSKLLKAHSKVITWSGTAPCVFKAPSEKLHGLIFYSWLPSLEGMEGTCDCPEELGFRPRAKAGDEASSVTGNEDDQSAEDEDPTKHLQEVIVTEAWLSSGPPPRGSGWWGNGAPIQVQHNYRTEDLVDGAGLCSPGRWHPNKRNLPDTGELAKDLVDSMGLDKDAWERTIMCMLAGKLKEDPFTKEQIQKGRCFLTKWCIARGVPLVAP